MAKGSRQFWAAEFLLEDLWKRVKTRRDVARWSRQILFDKLRKVVLCK